MESFQGNRDKTFWWYGRRYTLFLRRRIVGTMVDV